MKHELYYATGNAGKFAEIDSYITRREPQITMHQYAIDVDEIQSLDQRAIAVDKVKKVWQQLKKPVLVDDGGLFFQDYPNFPGVFSKYIFQTLGFAGLFKLVDTGAPAAFILQMAYTDGEIVEVFEGRCEGTIVKPQDFSAHPQLPFTAIFKPRGSEKTYAELRATDAEEFEKFAFRQFALKKFLAWYKHAYG